MRSFTLRSRAGFTLLEVIVVMAILVALAGLVVTELDTLQLKSEKAAAAVGMRDVGRFIQTLRATTNFYPDRWDSLIDRTSGTPTLKSPGAAGGLPGLDPSLVGGPPPGSSTKLALLGSPLTAGQALSLLRLGVTTVLDHNGSTSIPYGNGFVTANTIDGGPEDVFATINIADSGGQRILAAIYPTPPPGIATVPADRVLVVLGVGRFSTLVGSNLESSVLTEAPVYPYSNAQYYDRYLAVFEAYNDGSRCRLVAVIGADGDLAEAEIADFNRN